MPAFPRSPACSSAIPILLLMMAAAFALGAPAETRGATPGPLFAAAHAGLPANAMAAEHPATAAHVTAQTAEPESALPPLRKLPFSNKTLVVITVAFMLTVCGLFSAWAGFEIYKTAKRKK